MNKDQVKGALKNVAGKVQQEFGKIIDSDKQRAKGIAKQIEGKEQETDEDANVNIKDLAKGQW